MCVNDVAVIIPARGGSKRVPGKNLYPVNGKPLLHYTISHALTVIPKECIFVSSDSDEILSFSATMCETIKRPPELASDSASSESAIMHAIHYLRLAGCNPMYIVFLQCTSPVRNDEDVGNAILTMVSSGADSLVSLVPCNPFVWIKDIHGIHPATYDPANRRQTQDPHVQKVYVENGSIYIFKTETFMREMCRICGHVVPYIMDEDCAIDINTLDDIRRAELILRSREEEI